MKARKPVSPDIWGFAVAEVNRKTSQHLTDDLMQRFRCYKYNPEILTRSIELWIRTLIKGEILKNY